MKTSAFPAPRTRSTADSPRPSQATPSSARSVLSSSTHHITLGTADTTARLALVLAGTYKTPQYTKPELHEGCTESVSSVWRGRQGLAGDHPCPATPFSDSEQQELCDCILTSIFMRPSVTYLGHRINAEGLHP